MSLSVNAAPRMTGSPVRLLMCFNDDVDLDERFWLCQSCLAKSRTHAQLPGAHISAHFVPMRCCTSWGSCLHGKQRSMLPMPLAKSRLRVSASCCAGCGKEREPTTSRLIMALAEQVGQPLELQIVRPGSSGQVTLHVTAVEAAS